ncbi:hypothetical protein [Terriglobus albidus]|uniref:hypothetical protein n=1 Tax=Terriglobus albidus TaxID=1592106 RepID=UPI0021DFBF1A|nr:hypothetical protein [Terriglobus albidus]
MLNYFNYFTEIEQRFQQRRGSLLMLSTLDWALIETWRDAGIPLEAVLRGIDQAFDKYDERQRRAPRGVRKVNGLAWCAQAVMEATEEMKEAAIGASKHPQEEQESGFEGESVARYLESNAGILAGAKLAAPADAVAAEVAARLRALAAEMRVTAGGSLGTQPGNMEQLDRTLTVLEEKLFAGLMTAAPEAELTALREQAARELAPYRSRMQAVQIRQVEQQFLQKRILEARNLPRLSLFYMTHDL